MDRFIVCHLCLHAFGVARALDRPCVNIKESGGAKGKKNAVLHTCTVVVRRGRIKLVRGRRCLYIFS